jgi:hypothetical protein
MSLACTCFGHTCGHPQGGVYKGYDVRILQKLQEPVQIVSCKLHGLKYAVKYKIRMKLCAEFKRGTNVPCSYSVCVCVCVREREREREKVVNALVDKIVYRSVSVHVHVGGLLYL